MKEIKEDRSNGSQVIKQEHILETILENMAQAVVIVSADYKIAEFNKKFKEFFKLKNGLLKKGIDYRDFLERWIQQVEISGDYVKKAFERLELKKPGVFEIEFKRDGENKTLQMFHNPLDEGGFVRTFIDITNRKNNEKELKEKSTELDRFLNLATDFICISDPEGKLLKVNNLWQTVLGFDIDEMTGKPVFDFIHPDDIEETKGEIEKLLAGKAVVNFVNRYICKNGTYRWLEWRATPSDNGFIYAAARDITDSRNLEDILRQNEEKFRFLTENVGDMIWQIDKDYNYTYVSPSVESILGYTPEEINGRSFYDFITPDSADQMNELEKTQIDEYGFIPLKGGVYELQFIRKDGILVWCEVHSSPLYNPYGALIFGQGVTRDISTRKEAERKLKDYAVELKDLNTTKDRFFSIISHDLKSPFTGLLGMTKEFKENAEDFTTSEISEFGKEMFNVVLGTYRLLENLLEWSRIQLDQIQFDPSPLNVHDEVEKIFELLAINADPKEIKLVNNVAHDIAVDADENMISTILRNLIGNAIKFTLRGGTVKAEAERGKSSVLISIKDSGVGMSEEITRKLFRPDTVYTTYGTEKEKGTGLGLLLCREFVEKHNGRIWVQSEPGNGSTFYVMLPAIKEK